MWRGLCHVVVAIDTVAAAVVFGAPDRLDQSWVASEQGCVELLLARSRRREDCKVGAKVSLLLLVKGPEVVYAIRRGEAAKG